MSQPEKPIVPPTVFKPVPVTPTPKPAAPTDLALTMVDAFVQATEVRELTHSDHPVLLLTPPQNMTGNAVDTRLMASVMSTQIQAKSGFRLTPPEQVAAIAGQLEYQQGELNPASLVRLGRQSGAHYMLYGELTAQGGRYRLTMRLMELKSGELVWSESRTANH